jgi:hypothetical protein
MHRPASPAHPYRLVRNLDRQPRIPEPSRRRGIAGGVVSGLLAQEVQA